MPAATLTPLLLPVRDRTPLPTLPIFWPRSISTAAFVVHLTSTQPASEPSGEFAAGDGRLGAAKQFGINRLADDVGSGGGGGDTPL